METSENMHFCDLLRIVWYFLKKFFEKCSAFRNLMV